MSKQITASDAPAAIGPYSHAIDTGSFVFVSGQLPVDPALDVMPASAAEQAKQSLANVKAILAAAGLGMDAVVKTTVFLADMNDFAEVNAIYEAAFSAPFPARSCVQVGRLPKDALVEIEVIAQRS